MKIALAQINPTVGDFAGNAAKILEYARRAAEGGAEVALFPELAICGYPPADLLEKPSFVARAQETVDKLARDAAQLATPSGTLTIICGSIIPAPPGSGKHVSNAAVVLRAGHVEFTQLKMLLPFYDVFDEQRYFAPAEQQCVYTLGAERVALTICEDAWNDKNYWGDRRYSVDPVEEQMRQKPSVILNISASPYWHGKREVREKMLAAIARHYHAPVVMANQVGGNDSLIFDGTSVALRPDGSVFAQAASFAEDLVFLDTAALTGDLHPHAADDAAATYEALVLGTRDYVQKCGFRKAVIGLSGGIDSAVVAAIAVDALGQDNVLAIGMPSEYSSAGSIHDSRELAADLGISFEILPIHSIFLQYTTVLAPLLSGHAPDVTEENLQSRIRGGLLTALSNKLGSLVLTTGNKSEMATGYCTLYGDMVGALAVIGDLTKTRVYALARYINRERAIIPEIILTKPPSAELRPGQMDSDSLPPYDVLDPIVEAYVERYETPETIAGVQQVELSLVRQIVRLIERSEYKRQQAAPVLKVTSKSFGSGRRFPIAVKVQV